MTAIDSDYIDWCAECGAALMPENATIHKDWHREQTLAQRELAEQVRELIREQVRAFNAAREEGERA